MPTITKIETQKNKKRVNIFVDGSFFCGLNKETAILFGLKENKEIDEQKLREAAFESEVKSAFEKGLDYLGRRMHTKKELCDKLVLKGYEKEVAKKAIEKMEEYRYIDDMLFAKQFATENKKYSKKMLQEKLYQKGVSRDIVSQIIGDRAPEDEFELCKVAAEKYLKSKPVKTALDLQKLQASLARKGFDFDVINKVCRAVCKTNE